MLQCVRNYFKHLIWIISLILTITLWARNSWHPEFTYEKTGIKGFFSVKPNHPRKKKSMGGRLVSDESPASHTQSLKPALQCFTLTYFNRIPKITRQFRNSPKCNTKTQTRKLVGGYVKFLKRRERKKKKKTENHSNRYQSAFVLFMV